MKGIDVVYDKLKAEPKTWLVAGVSGFIGSNLLEQLLLLGQRVVGLDNFSAGRRENLDNVRQEVGEARWLLFSFIEGDIRNPDDCRRGCAGVVYVLHQDGETSRDFCYLDNVVRANILAATTGNEEAVNRVYNIAFGQKTTLNELFAAIREMVGRHTPGAAAIMPVYGPSRPGDVRHSLADISLAGTLLGYHPEVGVSQGLRDTVDWFARYAGL